MNADGSRSLALFIAPFQGSKKIAALNFRTQADGLGFGSSPLWG